MSNNIIFLSLIHIYDHICLFCILVVPKLCTTKELFIIPFYPHILRLKGI